MRSRDLIICLVSLILAAALLVTAGMQLDYINSERQRMKLIINEPLKNAPPSLAFATVAMGAFRGLVVDILWIRAEKLKAQGQFFDAKQLAEWITILQPRLASVWVFHAWNMAYNISVTIPETQPEERWRWVKNGYELLRDRGIPMNPKSISLYRELANIFQHKMGAVTDAAHKYYKLQLALAMEPLLGEADNDYFKKLAQAPASWQEIIADSNVVELLEALEAADEAFVIRESLVENYMALRENPDRFKPAAFEVIDKFRGKPTLKKFDIFAKAYQLREVWKLDPVLMQQLNQNYGRTNFDDPNEKLPLEWRHPQTHAIYWAVKGLQTASKEKPTIEETSTDRIVYHSLQALFRNGKIFIHDKKEIFTRSDLSMFQSYNKASSAAIEKYKDVRGRQTSHEIGHRNMLHNAIFSFYQAGHRNHAQKIYNQLKKLYPRPEFNVPLVAFVKNRLREELESLTLTNAKEMIQMMMRESYFRYAVRDDDESANIEDLAEQVYNQYQSMYRDENRINLPKLPMMRYLALLDFLNDPRYPLVFRQDLFARIKIEKPALAEKLKQEETERMKLLKQQESQ